ncbi:MAG: fibronectin type III domain-containing protein, partial [Planctomycetota bacterium]
VQPWNQMMTSGADAVDFNADGDFDILTGQGHGGGGLRYYERDYIENDLSDTHPLTNSINPNDDTVPPGQVTGLIATSGVNQNFLMWTNPTDADFMGTVVRYSTTDYPADPSDGTFLLEIIDTPGSGVNYVHTGLTFGITYYYSVFACDGSFNYTAAHAAAMPSVPGDFEPDGDVDQEDFGYLQNCFSGSGSLPTQDCQNADLDGDLDVDLQDFLIFQGCMGGSGNTPGC